MLYNPETAHGRAQMFSYSQRGADLANIMDGIEDSIIEEIQVGFEEVLCKKDQMAYPPLMRELLDNLAEFRKKLSPDHQAELQKISDQIQNRANMFVSDVNTLSEIVNGMEKVVANAKK